MMMDDIKYFWQVHRKDFFLFLTALVLARIIYYLFLLLVDIWRKK